MVFSSLWSAPHGGPYRPGKETYFYRLSDPYSKHFSFRVDFPEHYSNPPLFNDLW
jgi:hypothetical protein